LIISEKQQQKKLLLKGQ